MIYDIPHGRNRGTLLRTNPHEVWLAKIWFWLTKNSDSALPNQKLDRMVELGKDKVGPVWQAHGSGRGSPDHWHDDSEGLGRPHQCVLLVGMPQDQMWRGGWCEEPGIAALVLLLRQHQNHPQQHQHWPRRLRGHRVWHISRPSFTRKFTISSTPCIVFHLNQRCHHYITVFIPFVSVS